VTLQDLGNLGEILGALAVVVSLFYVGSQIRQNTAAVRSSTAQAVHDNYAAWYSHLAADGELVRISIQGLKDYASLPDVEKARFVSNFMAFLSYSQNAFYQWREGSLTPQLWVGWEALMINLVSSPGGKQFWAERAYAFGEEFRSHVVNVIMKRTPAPEARPLGVFKLE
jgi:hypothetical protein